MNNKLFLAITSKTSGCGNCGSSKGFNKSGICKTCGKKDKNFDWVGE